jgi:hypothetical protein
MYQSLRLVVRIFLTVWAVVLGFGLGVETSRGAIAYPSCEQICKDNCVTHDGCDDFWVEGSSCIYLCLDGHLGETVMGK